MMGVVVRQCAVAGARIDVPIVPVRTPHNERSAVITDPVADAWRSLFAAFSSPVQPPCIPTSTDRCIAKRETLASVGTKVELLLKKLKFIFWREG
jgi:hypothetical protein